MEKESTQRIKAKLDIIKFILKDIENLPAGKAEAVSKILDLAQILVSKEADELLKDKKRILELLDHIYSLLDSQNEKSKLKRLLGKVC